mgnify:FL=1
MVSKHYQGQRSEREKFIDEHFKYGYMVDEFIVDKGHPHGAERHCITNNGIIIIFNLNSGKLVTKLIAREGQIRRYYYNLGREPPSYLIDLARQHESLGYNHI